MGTYHPKSIICRSNNAAELEAVCAVAVGLFQSAFADNYDGSLLISPILHTNLNSECSCYVAPDGGSLESERHQEAEAARVEFITYLKYETGIDWALVWLGGDTHYNKAASLVEHNNNYLEADE